MMIQDKGAEEYIQQLKFKHKRFGGCDEEDVFVKIRELDRIYFQRTQALREQLEQSEKSVAELNEQLQRVRQENQENQDNKAPYDLPPKEVVVKNTSGEDYTDKVRQLDSLLQSI